MIKRFKHFLTILFSILVVRLQLLRLMVNGSISVKYWLSYDYTDRWIFVTPMSVDEMNNMYMLEFNKQLKLVGEDVYKVVGTNNSLVNKEIVKPIHNAVYSYDRYSCAFMLIFDKL